ncbi:DUF1579 family protein [Armatimonas rosea]|uniref:DUF1579 domain-containing protein n=1 Tax=Armatimonas rosea TaxID=685828 RepID=A0A7W9SWL2_ARMRO|nr:DUF1579 family protein [Armatimonas rosea]MBB6053738.1 hypothetical protein [Armatimonas rosea]
MKETMIGAWVGTNLLNLSWLPNPQYLSDATLTVARVAGGNFFEVAYTWSHEEIPHSGRMLISVNPGNSKAQVAWCDSWHQSVGLMLCDGTVDDTETLTVLGTYGAPPGPDWGWRITLGQPTDETLELVMVNIPPGGPDDLAVRATFTRAMSA